MLDHVARPFSDASFAGSGWRRRIANTIAYMVAQSRERNDTGALGHASAGRRPSHPATRSYARPTRSTVASAKGRPTT